MTGTVLILGANGKFGAFAAQAFWNRGWRVRLYDRATGDLTGAAHGADVIVNGLNPPAYHDWDRLIPAIHGEVIAAAKAAGATVILPGNVYNFGDVGGVWDETTPQRPVARKGRIRVEMEEAYRASGVRTIVLRAGNVIAPGRDDDMPGELHLRNLRRGRIESPGDPDIRQPWCYVPDWAEAAVMLAERRAELAAFEDVPFPGHVFSVNEMRDALAAQLGRELRVVRFPWWMMRLAAPVWELARELLEMRYLWDVPHELSGAKLARLVPEFRPTDIATVMRAALPGDVHPDEAMPRGVAHLAAE